MRHSKYDNAITFKMSNILKKAKLGSVLLWFPVSSLDGAVKKNQNGRRGHLDTSFDSKLNAEQKS